MKIQNKYQKGGAAKSKTVIKPAVDRTKSVAVKGDISKKGSSVSITSKKGAGVNTGYKKSIVNLGDGKYQMTVENKKGDIKYYNVPANKVKEQIALIKAEATGKKASKSEFKGFGGGNFGGGGSGGSWDLATDTKAPSNYTSPKPTVRKAIDGPNKSEEKPAPKSEEKKVSNTTAPKTGGKTISQIWTEKTGMPWAEAKKQGVSDGSAASNMKLLKDLKAGKYDKKESIDRLPTKKVSTIDNPDAKAPDAPIMQRGGTVKKTVKKVVKSAIKATPEYKAYKAAGKTAKKIDDKLEKKYPNYTKKSTAYDTVKKGVKSLLGYQKGGVVKKKILTAPKPSFAPKDPFFKQTTSKVGSVKSASVKGKPVPVKKKPTLQSKPVVKKSTGPTVKSEWESKTGTPWKEAKERGLTDGSRAQNMRIREDLKKGENFKRGSKLRSSDGKDSYERYKERISFSDGLKYGGVVKSKKKK